MKPKIRLLKDEDIEEVSLLELHGSEFYWNKEELKEFLQQKRIVGLVACYKNNIVGFIIYELKKHRIHVWNFVVDVRYRRKKIGTTIIEHLKEKLQIQNRKYISIEVRESNLDLQLFLKNHHFIAKKVLQKYYEDNSEDAYLMVFAGFKVVL